MFPGFLTLVLRQLFFPKLPTTFLTYFRGERRKYAGQKVCLNQILNSQPPVHESDTLTTEPPGWGWKNKISPSMKKGLHTPAKSLSPGQLAHSAKARLTLAETFCFNHYQTTKFYTDPN